MANLKSNFRLEIADSPQAKGVVKNNFGICRERRLARGKAQEGSGGSLRDRRATQHRTRRRPDPTGWCYSNLWLCYSSVMELAPLLPPALPKVRIKPANTEFIFDHTLSQIKAHKKGSTDLQMTEGGLTFLGIHQSLGSLKCSAEPDKSKNTSPAGFRLPRRIFKLCL